MKYCTYRVFDPSIHQKPQSPIICGPFERLNRRKGHLGVLIFKKPEIFKAVTNEEAEIKAEIESYRIGD